MSLLKEKVTHIHHWTDKTFSFKTTRNMAFRFKNGEFAMIGLEIDGKPLLRAYSVVSPNHEDHLEFLSIKVPNGPLTSKLQHIKVNDEISTLISKSGALSKGLNYKNSEIVRASKLIGEYGLDLGLVGKVDKIKTRDIRNLLSKDIIPVISPIGLDKKSQYLNINADLVAGKVAESLNAEKLILLTDVKGIKDDEGNLLSKITSARAKKILKNGIVKGGMVPKLIAALEATKQGVSQAHIIDGRVPHAVMLEILTKEGVGTLIS